MDGYTMQIRKDRNGWRAETYIELRDVTAHAQRRDSKPGVAKLSISTSKGSRGLSSLASVAFHGEDGFTVHAMGMGTGLGDFARTILRTEERATEKHIRTLHEAALKLVPDVLAAVRAHYAAQEAKPAA